MPTETLHILTLSVCLFTLTLATAALMPQLKRALVLVRDAMLGAMFVVALSFAGFFVWGWVFNGKFAERTPARSAEPYETREVGEIFPSNQETLDPLPLPSMEDEIAASPTPQRFRAVVSTNPVRPR